MNYCLNNISPDSFTGAILALEGIRDSIVLLNGPTGCKFYHAATSEYQYPRYSKFDPLTYPDEFYFGQSRLPSTYLDGYDYVYGSLNKLSKLLDVAISTSPSIIAIINSPGAALIGDDIKKLIKNKSLQIPCFAMESTGFSGLITEGFQNSTITALKHIVKHSNETLHRTVNLVGPSIYHKHFEGSILEIKKMLKLCNIEVISVLCADSSLSEIEQASKAEYNLVIYPEYGEEIAKWMKDNFNMPYILPTESLPIGFEASECWIKNICKNFNVSAENALNYITECRKKSYLYISKFNSFTGLPKGAKFSVKADPSTVYFLTKWLCSYMGMIPSAIDFTLPDNIYSDKLKSYLDGIDLSSVLNCSVDSTSTNIVFSDGNTISQLKAKGLIHCGIEISIPSIGYIDVVPKSLLGCSGSLFLVEQILNCINTML